MAMFTLDLLFLQHSLPEMHVVGLIRGVTAWQCLFIDGFGWFWSWKMNPLPCLFWTIYTQISLSIAYFRNI